MIPSVPNKFPQFLVALSVALFSFSIYSIEVLDKNLENLRSEDLNSIGVTKEIDSVLIINDSLSKKNLLKSLDIKYSLDSLKIVEDKSLSEREKFEKFYYLLISKELEDIRISDSFFRIFNERMIKLRKGQIAETKWDQMIFNYEFKRPLYNLLLIFSLLLFIISIYSWSVNDSFDEKMKRSQNSKEVIHYNCQSCLRIFNSLVLRSNEANGEVN